MREMKVDFLEETICQDIFGQNYITLLSIEDNYYELRVVYDRYIEWEDEHR